MKILLILCLALTLLCSCLPALADKPEYSLSQKGSTALQNEPNRSAAAQAAQISRDRIPGESPQTPDGVCGLFGLAWVTACS
jgi:hypothetical protein